MSKVKPIPQSGLAGNAVRVSKQMLELSEKLKGLHDTPEQKRDDMLKQYQSLRKANLISDAVYERAVSQIDDDIMQLEMANNSKKAAMKNLQEQEHREFEERTTELEAERHGKNYTQFIEGTAISKLLPRKSYDSRYDQITNSQHYKTMMSSMVRLHKPKVLL